MYAIRSYYESELTKISREWNISAAYSDYHELLLNPEIDIVDPDPFVIAHSIRGHDTQFDMGLVIHGGWQSHIYRCNQSSQAGSYNFV